ncbi:TerD family protein [Novosphingobium album (ex Liu et al. 2023)]|uniref:TerD family protein n=1 Tax=Novosphingobium album (ex Liu et al. 2023) TaxID=3031130 RepID=A0ABT5WRF4_9SPHN|nr:TerD family protein [Novosphingobium album (ex Liu et al. 2023)]MDE8652316.1 TerD family protein [Novosphingobium album (ex Liu et al. 2023)]
MTDLQQGANAAVPGEALAIAFAWTPAAGPAIDADASAYLLTASGRVRGDADMVFYNQPQGAEGGVRFVSGIGQGAFEVDLARLPAAIERVVFCVTIHEAQARGQTLALLEGAAITVAPAGGAPALVFRPHLVGASEAAMTFGELYRRNGQWKFRAVGQGFNGGLAPLARSFGIDVAEDAPAAPPPPPSTPVRLGKVTLEKPGQTVSLEKRGASFGEITVNLNWSRGRKGLFGGGSAIDLDLGCLFELADGRKGVVQALGNVFGAFAQPPYIALSGDDRTGDVSQGETLRINGAYWNEIRRIAIFANIYDGVPNWQQTDGVVLVTMPDQPPVEVRMTEGRNDRRLCGIVLIENDAGRLKATRIVNYVRDQKMLDESLGWGLRWVAGRKD